MKKSRLAMLISLGLVAPALTAQCAYASTLGSNPQANTTTSAVYGQSNSTSSSAFNPLTASIPELIQHGFPVPPSKSNASAYQAWVKAVKSIKIVHINDRGTPTNIWTHIPLHKQSTQSSASSPVAGGETGWTGYYDTDSYSYDLAESTFTVPSISGSEGDDVATWVGIGGTSGSTLFQAGINQQITSGVPVESAFYEYVGPNGDASESIPEHTLGNVYPGDEIYSEVYYEGNNTFYYDVVDETANESWSNPVSTGWSSSDLTSADFIVEAPETGFNTDSYYTLPDFGSIQLSSCYAEQDGSEEAGGSWPNTLDDMSEYDPNGNLWPYSAASSWNSSGTSFTVYYHNS